MLLLLLRVLALWWLRLRRRLLLPWRRLLRLWPAALATPAALAALMARLALMAPARLAALAALVALALKVLQALLLCPANMVLPPRTKRSRGLQLLFPMRWWMLLWASRIGVVVGNCTANEDLMDNDPCFVVF